MTDQLTDRRTDRGDPGASQPRPPGPTHSPDTNTPALRPTARAQGAGPRREPQARHAARTLTRPWPLGSRSATLPLHRAPSTAGRERDRTFEPEALRRCARRDLQFPGSRGPRRPPYSRLFRNYDFRRLRGCGAGLVASESLYVADRTLIGYIYPSLTVKFNGLCKRVELRVSGQGDRPQKKCQGSIGGDLESRERSVSAVKREDTSAGIAQSQRWSSFYKSLSPRLRRSFRIKYEVVSFAFRFSVRHGQGRNRAQSGLGKWPKPANLDPGSSLRLKPILVLSILHVSAPSSVGKSQSPDLFPCIGKAGLGLVSQIQFRACDELL